MDVRLALRPVRQAMTGACDVATNGRLGAKVAVGGIGRKTLRGTAADLLKLRENFAAVGDMVKGG